MNYYQQIIYLRSYARWDYDKVRRETFPESVERYFQYIKRKMHERFPRLIGETIMDELETLLYKAKQEFLELGVVGSMRAFWTAGKALEKENACGFNCAYTTIERPKDFAEILYLLLCGAGVSYSAERQFIVGLPQVNQIQDKPIKNILFGDSKLCWADDYYKYITALFDGIPVTYNLSKIRPKGSILRDFGGRASGPEPLKNLLDKTKAIIDGARGRKLYSTEVADIVCHIAEAVVVGGARRSATLALTNPSDRRMMEYKSGDFGMANSQRYMVNVSSAFTEKPEMMSFMEDWMSLVKSRSGERGIVNRESFHKTMNEQGREITGNEGVNPCGEIILKSKQFCNLSEVVCRENDTIGELSKKVSLATVLGFCQSLLTDYHFISQEWKDNAINDRLLGVSLTGLRDCKVLNKTTPEAANNLSILKEAARNMEAYLSKGFGIQPAKAVTCVKPSGTVSQLASCSSGLHAQLFQYYIRRVRVSDHDPIGKFLIDGDVPYKISETRDTNNVVVRSEYVFEFPMKSPEHAVMNKDLTALDQLEYWKMLKENWCDHNPSCTIHVADAEWLEVGSWVYKNWDCIGGLSFFPKDNNVYNLAPYEEITREQFLELEQAMPTIDFSGLANYEKEDYTEGSVTLACVGGTCEI